ncbi:hypothetical protein K523DRAFT_336256 [Schizophyllum commune Tattone D]|nr:hypothetical protein K523DRAFT_336256 [Schizophyllum commune Tattone D]
MYLLRRLLTSWTRRAPITLQTLPIDLLICILSEPELSPLDLVSLRKTCRALRDVLALRTVWLARAKAVSADDDTFCGDDDFSDVPLFYLENIVAAPFRITHFLENKCRGDASATPPCLPVQLAEQFSLLKSGDPEDANVRAVTIVRGGRYLIYVCGDELRLLDLWRSSRSVDEMLVASLALPDAFFYTVDGYWLTDDCELWVALTLRSEDNAILVCRAPSSPGGGRCLRMHAQITASHLRYCYRRGDLIAFSDGCTVGVWNYKTGARLQWQCDRLVLEVSLSSHGLYCVVGGLIMELHGFAIPDMTSASPDIQSQPTQLVRQNITRLRVNPTNLYFMDKDNARHINCLRLPREEDVYFTLDVLQIVAVNDGGIAQMVDYPDVSLVEQQRYTVRLGATFRDWYVSVWPRIHGRPRTDAATSSVLAIFAKRPAVDENGSSETEWVFKNAPEAGDYAEPFARNQGFDPTSDLLIVILCEPNLSPLDLIALRKTCRALYKALAQRAPWLDRAKAIRAQAGSFCGDDDFSDVPQLRLEDIVLAPARVLHFMEHNLYRPNLLVDTDLEDATHIPLSATMIRGGRYLLYIFAYQLRLLDLWSSTLTSSAACVASCELPQGDSYEVVDYWLSGCCELCVAVWIRGEREHTLLALQTNVSSQASPFRVRGRLSAPAIRYGSRRGDVIAFYAGTTIGIWDYTKGRHMMWNCGRAVHEVFFLSDAVFCVSMVEELTLEKYPLPDLRQGMQTTPQSALSRSLAVKPEPAGHRQPSFHTFTVQTAHRLCEPDDESAYITICAHSEELHVLSLSGGGRHHTSVASHDDYCKRGRNPLPRGSLFRDCIVSVWPPARSELSGPVCADVVGNGQISQKEAGPPDIAKVGLLRHSVEGSIRMQGFDPTSGTYWYQIKQDPAFVHVVRY